MAKATATKIKSTKVAATKKAPKKAPKKPKGCCAGGSCGPKAAPAAISDETAIQVFCDHDALGMLLGGLSACMDDSAVARMKKEPGPLLAGATGLTMGQLLDRAMAAGMFSIPIGLQLGQFFSRLDIAIQKDNNSTGPGKFSLVPITDEGAEALDGKEIHVRTEINLGTDDADQG